MRSIRTAAALAAALASALGPARAFAPARPAFGRRPSVPSSSSSSAAAAAEEDSSGDGQKPTMYPALSREEVEKFLQQIPVYAVTDSSDGGGVVLMSEADEESGKDKGVAYLFVTKEAATVTLQQLRGTTESSQGWDVTALSLGALWFQLIDGESQVRTASADTGEEVEVTTEHIEYRLTPDYRDLAGAKMLLSQSPEAKEAMEQSGIFSKTYGEVPVFMDLQIRAEEVGPDGERVEKFPMYLAMQDCVDTCQQFLNAQRAGGDGEGEQYEAAINVAELGQLVAQMQKDGPVDFRNGTLIPPNPDAAAEAAAEIAARAERDAPASEDEDGNFVPSMNDDWTD